MARKKKQKHRKAQKPTVGDSLGKALAALQQGNLEAVRYQAAQARKFAKTPTEQAQADQLLNEVTFRVTLKESSPGKKLAALAELVKTAPSDARLQFHYGIALLQTGNAKNAQQAFQLVAQIEPGRDGLAFFQQLTTLALKKLPDKSASLSEAEANTISALQKLQRQPSPSLARMDVAGPVLGTPQLWTELLTLRHDKTCTQAPAVEHLGRAHARPVAAAVLESFRGTAAMRADNQEAAMHAWQRAMSQGLHDTWLRKNLGLSTRREAQKLAAAGKWPALSKMAGSLPATLDDTQVTELISLAFFHVGYEHAQKEKWTQALTAWKKASEMSHNRYLAQNLALAYEHLDQFPAAADAWREMIRRRPRKSDHPDSLSDKHVSAIWAHAADNYFQAWQDDEAVTCFQKAIQYDPKNMTARFRLVDVYQEKEVINLDAAMRELNAILDIEPDNIEALTQLAKLQSDDWRYNAAPLWKRIMALEPDNVEAREALVSSYISQIYPPSLQQTFGDGRVKHYRIPPQNNPSIYKQRLSLIQEALDFIPDHPRLVAALGSVHQQNGKKDLACEAFLRAFELAPNNPTIASSIVQNLALMNETAILETLIPKIHEIPELLAEFWVDQGIYLLDRPQWAERFFDEAVRHVAYSPHRSKAGVLVDIYMALNQEGQRANALKQQYLHKIQTDVPQSGAVEYLDGFIHYQRTGNVSRARRKLRRARELAQAAHDTFLLQQIQAVEAMLSPTPDHFLETLLHGMDDRMLEQFLNEMEEGFL